MIVKDFWDARSTIGRNIYGDWIQYNILGLAEASGGLIASKPTFREQQCQVSQFPDDADTDGSGNFGFFRH